MAQSPFWMGYFDDAGSVAYVHSIDQFYGEVFGVGRSRDWRTARAGTAAGAGRASG